MYGPYVLSNNRSRYVNNAASALLEACKGLNSGIDFSRYDSNGDGKVDMTLMYYAGHNQAESGDATTIWPHQSYVQSGTALDGKYLDRYFCTSELKGTGSQMCGIGTTVHEFAHSLGLPDFYDTDYEENGQAGGLYSFSAMCEGSYLNNGRTPPYFNSEERILLGWMEGQTEISQQGSLTIGPIQEGVAYRTPTSVDGEYFVYECRSKTGWDRYIPNVGLLVYHVDKSTAHRVGNQTAYTHWARWEWYNKINAYLEHPCFYLVPAADQGNLQFAYRYFYNDEDGNPVYGFDSAQYPKIPFPGTKKVKTYLPVDWDGVNSDFRFTNIAYSNNAVTMTVSYTTMPGVTGRVLNTSAKPVRGATVSLSGNGIQRSVVTDVDGTYAFTGADLADRTFNLSVSCEGFVPAEASVSVGRKDTTLDFYLRRVDEPEEASFCKYDPSASTLSFGDGDASNLAAGILLNADELAPYVGKQLKSISFQLAGNASSSVEDVYVFVEVAGRRKLTQRADQVVFGALNTVNIVAHEFYIPAGSSMYIGYGVIGPSEADPLLVQKVEEMGIPVFVCHGPVTVAEVEENVRLMGLVLHQEAVGRKVIRTMENELNQIEAVVGQQQGNKPVGILLSLMSRYGGSGSLYDELAARGGWVNGLAKSGLKNGMEISREAVLAARPDFILTSQPYAEEKDAYEALQQRFFADPAYAGLQGHVRIVALPDRYVYDASPQLVYGIKKMANAAYGKELFPPEPEELLKGY